jgi:hypothetical protein
MNEITITVSLEDIMDITEWDKDRCLLFLEQQGENIHWAAWECGIRQYILDNG